MSTSNMRQLQWTQRIALARHNLHTASRSGDFGFFKMLQATGMMEGTNHFATLSAMLGDEADALLASLDNLNGALAFMHQDAFQSVYDNLKNSMRDGDKQVDRSKLYVDIAMQKNKTEMGIDKLSNSAINLINQQPAHVQEEAANVYITGLTLVADCAEVTTMQLDTLDQKMDDFIRLEESYNTVKASVLAATSGIKGVFYMLDGSDSQNDVPRTLSVSSAGSVFRRISNAFTTNSTARSSSVASAGAPRSSVSSFGPEYRTPNYVRNSVSAGCPTSMPPNMPANNSFANHNFDAFRSNFQGHKLSTIPPTPAYDVEDKDPFDMTDAPPVPTLPELPMHQRRMSTAVM